MPQRLLPYICSSKNPCSGYLNLTTTHHSQPITFSIKLWAYPPAAYYKVITVSVYVYFTTKATIKYTYAFTEIQPPCTAMPHERLPSSHRLLMVCSHGWVYSEKDEDW